MADLQKVAAALAGDTEDIYQTINRADFKTEGEYLDALTDAKMKRSDPAYSATRRQIKRELQEMDEQAERAAQEREYKKIRASVTLDPYDQEKIDRQAQEAAANDLTHGRITAAGLNAAVEKHRARLTEEAKDHKATGELFNRLMRGQ